MHLAYRSTNHQQQENTIPMETIENETVRHNGLEAYYQICRKYEQEIEAIRRYFPNWQPPFNFK
ncbi:hypothetical protein MUY27_03085 [Mucilaginibacter sp. RS28]|uniref:Uncharacterized protein n=1 Tax=Mucilaginibacter straminoryzae TaxID=2932774 RepID=A0A9X1X0S4_9SPHI|nr:hypothetical protein [Mucilaginibacter straminoryzae]